MRTQSAARLMSAFLALFLYFSNPEIAAAEQVVSKEARQWAHQAVAQESGLAAEPSGNTVAVLYFNNQTKRSALDPLQKGMTIMLTTDLAKLPEIQVVERTHLQALLEELRLGTSGLVDKQTAPRVGRLLKARYLVGGDFQPLQNEALKIESGLTQAPHADLLGTADSSGVVEDLIRMEKEILFEIIRLLKLSLSKEQEEELRKPMSTNIKALFFLFKGVQASDQGIYSQAAAHYQNALALDPQLRQARAALQQLQGMGIGTPSGTSQMLRQVHEKVSVNDGPAPDPLTNRQDTDPSGPIGPANSADVIIQWQ